MSEENSSIRELLERLETLTAKQELFRVELKKLRTELTQIQYSKTEPATSSESPQAQAAEQKEAVKTQQGNEADIQVRSEKPVHEKPVHEKPGTISKKKEPIKIRANLEEFIGGNLINKMGIAIIVIGVGIGVKYAIDHDLITPLMRIVLGYAAGLGLLAFAVRLKKEYLNFSAVLMSGSMAIFYFITYAAHSYFNLIPLWLCFLILVIFTFITVLYSLQYNRQVIAHIGLVGAFAVPFIFWETSGQPEIFFSYIALINIGILVLAVLKKWKSLYYSSFLITWLVFVSWFAMNYEGSEHFTLVLIILPLYFFTFYSLFLIQILKRDDSLNIDELLGILMNSLIFFGFGFYLLHDSEAGNDLKGLFTLANAAIHGAICFIIHRRRYPDLKLFYLVMGLVVGFFTLAVPVQFDGTWVTIIWAGEAAFLFLLGRTRRVPFFEWLSFGLLYLMTMSLMHDWLVRAEIFGSREIEASVPFLNMVFLASLICIFSYTFMVWLNADLRFHLDTDRFRNRKKTFEYIITGTLFGILYISLRSEIGISFTNWYDSTAVDLSGMEDIPRNFWNGNYNISCFRSISMIIYSMVFLSILSQLNADRFRNRDLAAISLIFNAFALLILLSLGLDFAGNLRDNYLNPAISEIYNQSNFQILIRYAAIAAAGILVYSSYNTIRNILSMEKLRVAFEISLVGTLLVLISTELIQWIDIYGEADSYKLALSILWGLCAVGLIIIGIWKKRIHLRISAIVLFSVTLLKLFFYDIRHLDTISKTIVFIILGTLLLITSFLYIKYKKVIFDRS